MILTTFSAFVMLFFIMDPLGNMPLFLSTLKKLEPSRRRTVLVRELFIALFVMVVFLFVGKHLLHFLNLKQASLNVGGGIILFLIALNMVFPRDNGLMGPALEDEPFIVPLAIPLIAGPSVIATLLILVKSEPARILDWMIALFSAWALSAVILFFSTSLYKILRPRGLIALERLMGMLLVMMSVQMFLDGISQYLNL